MNATFPTITEALAAGYRRPRPARRPDGDNDISGGSNYGYRYQEPGSGRVSVDVYLAEAKDAMARPGVYAVLFPPSPEDVPCTPERAAEIAAEYGITLRERTTRRGRLTRLWIDYTEAGASMTDWARLDTVAQFRAQCARTAR